MLLLFVANTINVGADLGAMARLRPPARPALPSTPLLIVVAVAVLGLEIFIPYRHYALVLSSWRSRCSPTSSPASSSAATGARYLLATVMPHIEFTPAFLTLLVAIIGTTISPYLFFWQASEEVEEKSRSSASGKRR